MRNEGGKMVMENLLGKHVLVEHYRHLHNRTQEVEGIIIGYDRYYYLVAFPISPNRDISGGVGGKNKSITYISNIKDFIGCDCMFCCFKDLLEIWGGD